MKGYKAFDKGYVCKGFQYEIGKTYTLEGEIEICKRGYHFCKNLIDVFGYYRFDRDEVVLAEVEALGDIMQEGTKYCTNKIKVLRAVDWAEVDDAVRDGDYNSGRYNSGNRNSGDCNSGDCNSGNYNSGDCNSGGYNSGNRNSGHYNSGRYNSGNRNSGHYNSGGWNSGNCNSGDYNSGHYNSGDRNSGHYNSGCWNSGNWNSGFFNSNSPRVRLFNRDSGMSYDEFFELDIDWGNLENSKEVIMNLPNFDAEIFLECTGTDWRNEND